MMHPLDCDWRRRWNIGVGAVVARQGQPELPAFLVAAFRPLVAFDHSVIFGYPPDRRPVFLYDGFSSDDQRSALSGYLRGAYREDPFYDACLRGVAPGLYRLEELVTEDAQPAAGAHPGYVSPCVSHEPGALSEEIGFFARTEAGAYVVLSLMRGPERPPFSETELEMLREVEPLVRYLLSRQWARLGAGEAHAVEIGAQETRGRLAAHIDAAIDGFGSSALTAREAEVARCILRGRPSGAIAQALGISVATVKIHRRHLYAKLGVGSQSELFAAFLDSLAYGAASPACAARDETVA
ncbi:helix-turn-helix transcriptional regulator [Salinarimonas sp.]|uniref:helix-turn-helix transcriptional regulator n=1 Tax=Salinarimonas sp. TaxID=2766526 RepID=UPI0032D96009